MKRRCIQKMEEERGQYQAANFVQRGKGAGGKKTQGVHRENSSAIKEEGKLRRKNDAKGGSLASYLPRRVKCPITLLIFDWRMKKRILEIGGTFVETTESEGQKKRVFHRCLYLRGVCGGGLR